MMPIVEMHFISTGNLTFFSSFLFSPLFPVAMFRRGGGTPASQSKIANIIHVQNAAKFVIKNGAECLVCTRMITRPRNMHWKAIHIYATSQIGKVILISRQYARGVNPNQL